MQIRESARVLSRNPFARDKLPHFGQCALGVLKQNIELYNYIQFHEHAILSPDIRDKLNIDCDFIRDIFWIDHGSEHLPEIEPFQHVGIKINLLNGQEVHLLNRHHFQ